MTHGPTQPAPGRAQAVTVWWAPLTLADVRLLGLLPEHERHRVEQAARPADRARRMLGAAVLRLALARETGAPAETLRIDRTCADCGAQHGRPSILDHDLHASVSHSGLLTVVALSTDPIGVDVQRDADLADGEVDAWVRAEARLKAGLDGRAPITVLHPPLPGHTAVLARAVAGPVDQRDAGELLPS